MGTLQYNDDICGLIEIREPGLLDMMNSQTMLQLRGVFQHGITALIGITPPFSQSSHCVGSNAAEQTARRIYERADRCVIT